VQRAAASAPRGRGRLWRQTGSPYPPLRRQTRQRTLKLRGLGNGACFLRNQKIVWAENFLGAQFGGLNSGRTFLLISSAHWRSTKRRSVLSIRSRPARAAISPAYSSPPAIRTKRSRSARKLLPAMTRLWDMTTLGQRTAPASPPTRSTRLAAQRRRRRCGSGMGSRSLRSPSPHEPQFCLARTFATVRSQAV
jgi:hypothetical protein